MKLQVEIIKLVPPGEGLGYFNNKAVFVPGTAVGDIVEVLVNKEKKHHITATLERVISPGDDRIEAACPHYDTCGGCSLMHLAYTRQIELKRQLLVETFTNQQLVVSPLFIPSPKEYHFRYRTNVKLENGVIGFAAKRSHRIVDIHDCRILSAGIMERLPRLLQLGRNQGEFALLESLAHGEVAASVGNGNNLSPLPGYPQSIIENYGFGDLMLNSNGFAQSNPFITQLICQDLLREVDQDDQICELYSGSGTFSVALASRVKALSGFDISKESITTASQNARSQHLDNVQFTPANLDKGIHFPDCQVVVADPPRKGLGAIILKQIGKSAATRLLYVSCNPSSLARDSKILSESHAFRLKSVTGYDMYCHSTHVEALAIFQR